MFNQNQHNHSILIEAEAFQDLGGWTLDTQFIHSMGSPYLIAHGLGKPVQPAKTRVDLPSIGTWYVWVRTKNWVPGPWEAPGRFKISVNGIELDFTFGEGVGEWAWEGAGEIELEKKAVDLSLIDLSGFNGRCDAIFLTQNSNEVPNNSSEPMNEWRREQGSVKQQSTSEYDLTVVGGGIAGCCAAVSAARAGLKVALIHDRSTLGGNASPEILVDPCGLYPAGRYPDIGDIVREISPKMKNRQKVEAFEEAAQKRLIVVEAEPNLDLYMEHYVYAVKTEEAQITEVSAMSAKSTLTRSFKSRFYVDGTGHGTIGLKAGADHQMESKERMGMTNYWKWRWAESEVSFPNTPWALQLTEKGFPYPGDGGWLNKEGKPARIQHDHPLFFSPAKKGFEGQWYWESGFDKHPLDDLEAIRDHNLRAAFGAFNAMKNHGVYSELDTRGKSHDTAEMYWMACIGGPRETLQLLGDVIVSEEDIYGEKDFPDACVPATWGIDLHYALPLWAKENPDNPFISRAHFDGRVDDTQGRWAESPRPGLIGEMRAKHNPKKGYLFPYRAFYSRNISNLFMAGRDISCTHEALGTIRVMNTLGMVGVVVGRAAALACEHNATNREVYEKHFEQFKGLLQEPGDYRVEKPVVG
jgi:hypothetical protein